MPLLHQPSKEKLAPMHMLSLATQTPSDTTMQNAYEKQIAVLSKKILGGRTKGKSRAIQPLLEALGCRVEHPSGTFVAPSASDEGVVRDALFKALQSVSNTGGFFGDSFAILDGLALNERWRGLLQSQETARCLVETILVFAQFQFDFPGDNCQHVARNVLVILNGWLNPPVLLTAVPSHQAVTRAFFGDAWCNLIADDLHMSQIMLNHLIESAAPPILEGLLPGIAIEPLPLPALA